jgi:hypothetical protein
MRERVANLRFGAGFARRVCENPACRFTGEVNLHRLSECIHCGRAEVFPAAAPEPVRAAHRQPLLTSEQRSQIRLQYANGVQIVRLMRTHKVSRSTITRALG